jgi:tetratricopeptide (TPR) repeat protein
MYSSLKIDKTPTRRSLGTAPSQSARPQLSISLGPSIKEVRDQKAAQKLDELLSPTAAGSPRPFIKAPPRLQSPNAPSVAPSSPASARRRLADSLRNNGEIVSPMASQKLMFQLSSPAVQFDSTTSSSFQSPKSQQSNSFRSSRSLSSSSGTSAYEPLRSPVPRDFSCIPARSLADYQVLAHACQRSGKTRAEAQAQFRMGLIFEEKGQLKKAVVCFDRVLAIARKVEDPDLEMLALNSVGIICMRIGDVEHLQRAVELHERHLKMADFSSRFTALMNFGLTHVLLESFEPALGAFREALEYAIRLENAAHEQRALANLARMATVLGDSATARACHERRIQLAHNNNAEAFVQLAELAVQDGDAAQATRLFDEARHVARAAGNSKEVTRSTLQLGVAAGNAQFEALARSLAAQLSPHQSM